jgi:predicted RNase H-like HicB family nuclease
LDNFGARVACVWRVVPRLSRSVADGRSYEEAVEKAEYALAQAVEALAEQGGSLPEPTPIERIVLPKGSDVVAYFIVGVTPPDPSERVNVYLPRSLVERIDRRAAELGMTRSSFFGLAATNALRPCSRGASRLVWPSRGRRPARLEDFE